jgi:polar amino acid transport system substrate-binding protein
MKAKPEFIFIIMTLIILTVSISFAEKLPVFNIMTEEWEPYNFEKDGVIQGVSVDILVLMLEKAGSSQGLNDIKIFPWARAYREIQEKPDSILFTTARTPEREYMFKWVGPIFEITSHFYALKKRKIKIRSFEDLKKYRIGTLRDDATETLIINKTGMKLSDFDRAPKRVVNLQKVLSRRVDMTLMSRDAFLFTCKESGLNPDAFEPVFMLHKIVMYYAFSRDTSDLVIKKLQSSLDEIKKSGTIDRIMKKYKK